MKQTTLHRVRLVLVFVLLIQVFASTNRYATAAPLPALVNEILFEDDFSDNSAGWTLDSEWQIRPAIDSGFSFHFTDPVFDHSDSQDNGVSGAVIGWAISTDPHDYYFLTSPAINTSAAEGPLTLEFYRWLNSDFSPFMTNKVEVFDGSAWVSLWESGGPPSIQDASWTQITHDLTPYKNANMRIRFGHAVGSYGSLFVSGWNIDDVRIFVPNSPPIVQDDVLSTAEDTPVNFSLNGTDINGDPLSFSIVTPPEHGSLSGEAPNLTYQPEADFYGNDSLTYFVNDGIADSAIATLSITVTAVNDAPKAGDFPDIQWTARWIHTYLNQTFSDVDGDVLRYTVTLEDGSDLPAWLLFDPETVTFSGTPSNDVTGSYAILVTAEDDNGGSTQVVFTLTVIANPCMIYFPFLGR